jgi:hypothetical protein
MEHTAKKKYTTVVDYLCAYCLAKGLVNAASFPTELVLRIHVNAIHQLELKKQEQELVNSKHPPGPKETKYP